jgi:hypothetical protein
MNGNATTIVVGVVGIVVAIGIASISYWLGHKDARALATKVDELRRILAGLVSAPDGSKPSAPEPVFPVPAAAGTGNLGEPDAALVRLVRTSLGVLQDEHGMVDLQLLLDEVGRAVGPERLPLVEDELRHLRASGALEWQAGEKDLSHIPVVRVVPTPARARRP